MNLQDIGQMGIQVAQHEYRATAVQVCSLNPGRWSILWTHGLPYLWQFFASASMQIAIFVFCYSTMWSNKIFLWRLSKRNNSHGSFLPHYGWSRDIFRRQPYKCVRYEMSYEANHIYFSCLIPVGIVFFCGNICCNNHFNETLFVMVFSFGKTVRKPSLNLTIH